MAEYGAPPSLTDETQVVKLNCRTVPLSMVHGTLGMPRNKKHSGWPTFLDTRWQQWGRSGCKKANVRLERCHAKFGLHSKKDRDISSHDKYSLPVVLIL